MGVTAKAIVDPSTGRFLVGNPGGGALRKGAGDTTNNYDTKKQRAMIRDMMDTKFDAEVEILNGDGTTAKRTWMDILGDMLMQMTVMGQATYPTIKLEDGQLSNSPLTLRDIDAICEAFCKVLNGVFHERIEYPTVNVPARPLVKAEKEAEKETKQMQAEIKAEKQAEAAKAENPPKEKAAQAEDNQPEEKPEEKPNAPVEESEENT